MLSDQLGRTFPSMRGVKLASAWRGPVDYAFNGLPYVGPIGRRNVLTAVGYSGNGVGPAYFAARSLAAQVLNSQDDPLPPALRTLAPGGMPPEPIRYLGGLTVRAAVERKECLEDQGRRPGRLTRAVANLDQIIAFYH